VILFLDGFHGPKLLFPLPLQRASHQAVFWLDRLVLSFGPLGLVARTLQAQLPLLAFGLLLLFQLRQGRERECQLIGLQRLQKPLFNLGIQSQRPHPLAVCSSKLALVGTTPILGIFTLLPRVVEVE
jgi:hypothetical protein